MTGIVSNLLPASLVGLSVGPTGGLKDIGNATAVVRHLAVHGVTPMLACDVGVRLAGTDDDRFLTVLQANRPVVGTQQKIELFITDASAGVARVLVCERYDPVREPSGRLLRVIVVPIDKKETWVDVTFEVGRDLVLCVSATGRNVKSKLEPVWIQQLNLGFKLPPFRRRLEPAEARWYEHRFVSVSKCPISAPTCSRWRTISANLRYLMPPLS